MRTRCLIIALLACALPVLSALSEPPVPSPAAEKTVTSDAEMMKQMMELAKPGENQKLIGTMAGDWNYEVTMWMAPNTPPIKSNGTTNRREMMGGRYYVADVAGTMKMPGADGKMMEMPFKGMSIEGYDNVKKKFVATWIDSMGTSITYMEGDYDAASKTFTYHTEMEMIPGMKTKVRETIKIIDPDHHTMDWYEDRGGQEVKTMEIAYTRNK